jgi:dihydropteroate synthase
MLKNTPLPDTILLNCRGKLLEINTPAIMGIINITDDSFYAASRHTDLNTIIEAAGKMLSAGAAILDLGAQSSRPGATRINATTEINRLIPAIEAILNQFPSAILSVDTYYATVASAAVNAGAHIINDISAGVMDDDMLSTVAQLKIPYIAMHMQGNPATMQQNPEYKEVVSDVLDFFIQKIHECQSAGISDIIIDPGFGFGKTLTHNYTLLKHLNALKILDKPLMAGISRKSMIYHLLDITPENALNATSALHMLALQNGATILRVHDVDAAAEVVRLWSYYSCQV